MNEELWKMMKDEWRMKNDEWWRMKDDDFKLLRGFVYRKTDGRTFVNVKSPLRLKTEEFSRYILYNKWLYLCKKWIKIETSVICFECLTHIHLLNFAKCTQFCLCRAWKLHNWSWWLNGHPLIRKQLKHISCLQH